MSDVIVSTTESTTNVTTVNDVTTIAITNNVVEVSQATAGLQGVPGSNSDPTYVFVTNKTGATLAKGSIVYVSGANGVHTQVSLALATGDITSARTLGWLSENIANNATGLCCVEGYLDGVDTQGVTEGAQLYLSPTIPGAFTETKPVASDHLVYVGVCAKASAGNGRVFVKVQNGYELNELHDVKTVNLANNDLLRYSASTALWENVAATAITVGSAITAGTSVYATNAATSVYASTSGTSVYATNAGTAVGLSGSITKSQVSDFTSGTVASASTAQQAGTAVYANTSGTSVYADTSGTSVYATNAGTSVYADTSGTSVYATNAGTSVYADTSGTATYATTSGTAVSISGTITRSQVSDYASGTVANISGTVTQSQVSNLVTDLAGKAGLADNNTFTGTNTFSNFTTFQAAADTIPIRVFGASGQSADLFSVNDYLTNTQFEILSDGRAQSLKGIIATVSSTASVPLVVRGTAGQSANLSEWQNSGSTVLARVDKNGAVSAQYFGPSGAGLLGYVDWTTNSPIFNTGGTAVVGLVVKGVASQSADLMQFQNSGGTNTVTIRPNVSGNWGNDAIFSGGPVQISPTASATGYGLFVRSGATGSIGVLVRGASGQTGDLQAWQNSGSTTLASISSSGSFFTNSTLFTTLQTYIYGAGDYGAALNVISRSTANAGVIVRGRASQSADLQQWQNSSGGTVTRVDSSGNIFGTQIRTLNTYVTVSESNSGGSIRLLKGTAAAAPLSNEVRLQVLAGTNANTLKLVAVGPNGSAVTILDNLA